MEGCKTLKKYREAVIISIFLFVIVSILTLPLILDINDKTIGDTNHPGLLGQLFHQYNISFNFKNDNIFKWYVTDIVAYPEGEKLIPQVINSLHLFLLLPFSLFLNPVSAYNFSMYVILILNGLAMYFLAKQFFNSKVISFTSAIFFVFNSYTLLKLHMGFLQKLILFWIPLYFIFLFRLMHMRKRRYMALAGIFLFLIQWTYAPYAYYTVLFTALLVIYNLFQRNEIKWVFVKDVFMILIFSIAMSLIQHKLFGIKFMSFLYPPQKIPLPIQDGIADIFHIFRFSPYHSPYYPLHLKMGLSCSSMLLACIAVIKKRGLPRFLFFCTVLFSIIALGPYLTHRGSPVLLFGHRIILPHYLLVRFFPFGSHLTIPIRIFCIINVCLALLIGFGLKEFASSFSKKGYSLAASLFLFIYFIENLILYPQIFPPKVNPIAIPKFFKEIKAENCDAILHLPLRDDRKTSHRYAFYTSMSGKKMLNSLYEHKNSALYLPGRDDSILSKRNFIKKLAGQKVRYIVLYKDLLTNEELENIRWIENMSPEYSDYKEDRLFVYTIAPSDRTVYVPGDYPLIQEAMNYASEGDLILVGPGTYYENIDFQEKVLTLQSEMGPELTVIDGRGEGPVVTFKENGNRRAILKGFTLTNGTGKWDGSHTGGGGIFCERSSPLIRNNIIKGNATENGGGILCLNNSSPKIIDNLIFDNKATKGGGIRCSDGSSPQIINNVIRDNVASMLGGGIYFRVKSYPNLINNTIIDNHAGEKGGGIFCSTLTGDIIEKPAKIWNSALWGNTAPVGSQIAIGNSTGKLLSVVNSILEGGIGAVSDPNDALTWEDTIKRRNIYLNRIPSAIGYKKGLDLQIEKPYQ